MSDDELAWLRTLSQAARPGPYSFDIGNELEVCAAGQSLGGTCDQATYDLIAAAANALPGLLAEVSRLRALVDAFCGLARRAGEEECRRILGEKKGLV